MPQLKIQDVKDQVDELEKTLTDKFVGLVAEIKNVLADANVATSEVDTSVLDSAVASMKAEVNTLRDDMIGHVTLYNKHIIQQHNTKKK